MDIRLGSNRNPNVVPIAFYRAEQGVVAGAVADEVGRHDGDATTGVTVERSGYRGQGFRFDGSGVITVPHDREFEFPGAFMVQAAVKPPPGQEQMVLEKAGDYRLALAMEGGALKARFTVSTLTGEESVTSVLPVPGTSWSLITGRYDSGRLSIGVDSSEDFTIIAESPVHSTSDLRIGPEFEGDLDEIRVTDLTNAPLSTFANGQQEISFTADTSGEFTTTIQSTGQLGSGRSPAPDTRSALMAALDAALDDGDASQVVLGGYFTDTVTFFRDRGTSSESSLGYVTNELLAYGFEFVSGVWVPGTGAPRA